MKLNRKTEVVPITGQCSPKSRPGLTFEEIAALQGVGPIEDPNELVGGWPGEIDDGFEEAVLAWRRNEPWPEK